MKTVTGNLRDIENPKERIQIKMPYRFKADSWRPARMKRADHVFILVTLIVIAYIHGIDYTFGNDTYAARDYMIAAAPEWVWGGVGFLTGATILLYGVLTRRHLFVWLGHGWLGISYGITALAQVLSTSPWYFDGIRGGGSLFLVMALNLIQMIRTGPAPLKPDNSRSLSDVTVVPNGEE